ncbi:MAG: hypothetical protein FWF51_10385 [Chitinivibrionia bacterium]|nr:hypothetical protein [Chitinivibrionia bacterium]
MIKKNGNIKSQIFKIIFAIILCVFSCFAQDTYSSKKWFNPKSIFEHGRFQLLPEYYFEQDARFYSNHKNEEYKESYLISALTDFTGYLVSFDSTIFFGGYYVNYLGMGRQNEAILFDPRDVHYALTPFFEFRWKVFYQMGLDHRCFHEIDRKERESGTIYWNQIYVKVSSANYRFQQMNEKYINGEERGDFLDKLRWQAGAGYFYTKKDRTLFNGGHPWSATVWGDVGYSFYRTNNWIFGGRSKVAYYADTTGKAYYVGEVGLEADVYKRKHSVGFFINGVLEFPRDMPVYPSKDKLVEWGIRWRY